MLHRDSEFAGDALHAPEGGALLAATLARLKGARLLLGALAFGASRLRWRSS
jgi:hypothetical protein